MTALSLHFDGHFPGGPGLAGTRMSPFWILLQDEKVVVTTGAIRCAKHAGCPSCHPTSSVKSLKERTLNIRISDVLSTPCNFCMNNVQFCNYGVFLGEQKSNIGQMNIHNRHTSVTAGISHGLASCQFIVLAIKS